LQRRSPKFQFQSIVKLQKAFNITETTNNAKMLLMAVDKFLPYGEPINQLCTAMNYYLDTEGQ
jgi:hypothetical protein